MQIVSLGMKCQILFSRKTKKILINLSPDLVQRVVKVKYKYKYTNNFISALNITECF